MTPTGAPPEVERDAHPDARLRSGSRKAGRAGGVALVLVLVAVAVLGDVRYGVTFWRYRGFPPPSRPSSVVVQQSGGSRTVSVIPGQLVHMVVPSPGLGGFRDPVDVLLPPGYATNPQRRYPVLYLLHGSPGEPTNFVQVGAVVVREEVLVAEKRAAPTILVMPTGGRSTFSDTEWADARRPGNAWETFVAHDLVAAIDARFRTIARRQGRGIAGLSEGGYGALNIGLHHPDEFQVIESWSGYTHAYPIPAVFGRDRALLRYNSPALFLPSVAARLRAEGVYIWAYGGDRDPLRRQGASFAAQLDRYGIQNRFFVASGRHGWAIWRAHMDEALVVAGEHVAHG